MARFRTLLVDDVADLRRMLRHVLEWSERFEVVGEAGNGREAIGLTAELQPDLILLDISMPVMDGMEALPHLIDAAPNTTVVMLSAFEAERLATASLELGAAGYVEKGTSPATLISNLFEYLNEGSGNSAEPEADRAPGVQDVLSGFSTEDMMSLVAHEIRNPLAVIQGFGMELYNRWDDLPDHVRKDALKRIADRARYLNSVVNNLMFMRRIRDGSHAPDMSREEVAPLLETMVDELRDMARDNPVELEMTAPLPAVKIDVSRLRQVLVNLVVNAARFSPPARPILLSAAKGEGGVALRVIDDGPGIPKDKRDEVFEKFTKLQHGGSGIGLGLFISRALMEAMGGRIWIEDAPDGTGACLACLLPLA